LAIPLLKNINCCSSLFIDCGRLQQSIFLR
jgi:hypothetical protein